MSTTSKVVSPPVRLNAEGRLIPYTEEEQAQHTAAIRAAVAILNEIPDDPDEDDAEFFRAFDSHRPDAPMFKGLY